VPMEPEAISMSLESPPRAAPSSLAVALHKGVQVQAAQSASSLLAAVLEPPPHSRGLYTHGSCCCKCRPRATVLCAPAAAPCC
jgi:hypothetical protein